MLEEKIDFFEQVKTGVQKYVGIYLTAAALTLGVAACAHRVCKNYSCGPGYYCKADCEMRGEEEVCRPTCVVSPPPSRSSEGHDTGRGDKERVPGGSWKCPTKR